MHWPDDVRPDELFFLNVVLFTFAIISFFAKDVFFLVALVQVHLLADLMQSCKLVSLIRHPDESLP